jgi:hypothetical protein
MNELLGEQDAPRLRDRNGSGADVCAKKAAKLTLADSESIGKQFDVAVIEGAALDQL